VAPETPEPVDGAQLALAPPIPGSHGLPDEHGGGDSRVGSGQRIAVEDQTSPAAGHEAVDHHPTGRIGEGPHLTAAGRPPGHDEHLARWLDRGAHGAAVDRQPQTAAAEAGAQQPRRRRRGRSRRDHRPIMPSYALRMERVVDVAGIALRITTASAVDEDLVLRVVGRAETTAPPDAHLVVDGVGPPVPNGPPDFHGPYGDHWDDGVTHWFRHQWGLTARVTPPDAVIGGRVAGQNRWVTVRNSMLFVLARLLAPRAQFLLHGAAVQRDGGALLAVGPSGAGKSSLAFAAHLSGWSVCGDDMVAVAARSGGASVRGISRVPTLPADVAAEIAGELLPEDPRRRLELTWFELDPAPVRLIGVVICGHDPGDGTLAPASTIEALEALVPALVLSALAGPVTEWFPVAAQLARGPCFRLGHAADPARRLRRAGELLDEAWRAAAAQ
jgi:hypothetical protein